MLEMNRQPHHPPPPIVVDLSAFFPSLSLSLLSCLLPLLSSYQIKKPAFMRCREATPPSDMLPLALPPSEKQNLHEREKREKRKRKERREKGRRCSTSAYEDEEDDESSGLRCRRSRCDSGCEKERKQREKERKRSLLRQLGWWLRRRRGRAQKEKKVCDGIRRRKGKRKQREKERKQRERKKRRERRVKERKRQEREKKSVGFENPY